MDYEKKYKEALELARVAAFNGHQSLMEGIFPELAESEDEKTRKEIIYHIKNCDDTIDEETEKRMIAWLENIPYTIDHEKREGFHLGYKAGLEKQGKSDKIVEKAKIEKQRVLVTESDGSANIDWDTRSLEDARKLLEYGLQYINTELEKQGEQKTAWSEKDEKEYKYVLRFVDNILNNCGNKKDYEHCKRCYDWLKSLKQRIGG